MLQDPTINSRIETATRYRRCVTNPVTHTAVPIKKKQVISRSSSINSNQNDQYRTAPIRNPIFENEKSQENMITISEKKKRKESEHGDIPNEE